MLHSKIDLKKMIKATIFFLIISIYFSNCAPVSENEINNLINSFQTNVEKKYEEASNYLSNGTVSKFNIPFRLKLYSMKLDISRMERDIEKLKNPATNDNKHSDDYYKNERAFGRAYKHLLNIMIKTNNYYNWALSTLKKVFVAILLIIFFGGIIALIIMYYIYKTRYKDYSALVENDKQDNKNQYQIVKIFNSFFNFKKLK